MKEHQRIYRNLKFWFNKQMRVEQPKINTSQFEEQRIHLEPIFDSQTNAFVGAQYDDLELQKPNDYLQKFKRSLENIAYWHCHGRAILTLLPLPVQFLKNPTFFEEYKNILILTQLPVGLIRVPLMGYHNETFDNFENQLRQLQRLGLILELKNFTGSNTELTWLKSSLFQGLHFSTALLRAAMTTSLTKELFDDLLITCKQQNYHTYSEGISLVHDFTFSKNNNIQFCYGPLMMPAVSKHQILKIHTSQLTDSFNFTPNKTF